MRLLLLIIVLLLPVSFLGEDLTLRQFLPSNRNVIKHSFYDLQYDSNLKNPKWVIWQTTTSRRCFLSRETITFKIDPKVESANPDVFIKSGFDRGHMCPAEDMSFNQLALEESFYTSNICPQEPTLNRGLWKSLEAKSRKGHNVIVTGPIFFDYIPRRELKNGIRIPDAFFRVIYDLNKKDVECFIILNMKLGHEHYNNWKRSLVDVKKLTNINFRDFTCQN